MSKAQWAAAAEAASLDLPLATLRQARLAFRKLAPGAQLRLAQEAAEARGPDFTRAIRNVVALTAGLKRCKDRQGRERLLEQPCVIFIVRNKWSASGAGPAAQQLPHELLSHADVDGQRVLCAIPTDVQTAEPLAQVRVQARTGVDVADDGASAAGTLAWSLRIGGQGPYVLAPVHVLSPLPDLARRGLRAGAKATLYGDDGAPEPGPQLLTALSYGGRLVPSPALSFDAQLAKASDLPRLRQALAGLRISKRQPVAQDVAEVMALSSTKGLLVMVADNHPALPGLQRGPLQARFSQLINARMPQAYQVAGGQTALVSHLMLLELELALGNDTLPGDSGAAVVAQAQDGFTLVGMHIAGVPGLHRSIVLPAWMLFDRLRYERLPAGSMEPMNL